MFRYIVILIIFFIFDYSYCFAYQESDFTKNNIIGPIIMIIALFLIIYLLIIKPQTRKIKEHNVLVNNLRIGDEVITTGGILGKIIRFNQQFIILELSRNTRIVIQKNAILAAIPNGTLSFL